jgi:beta-N-acetylhexosaminidase
VVFAFDAPYYLDTTDLSKLTAYYALYSHAPPFVSMAARLLFRDITPNGAPPVSVPATGYDLISVTRHDPAVPIDLFWQKASASNPDVPETTLQINDVITVTTGVLLDHNGNQVPDDTFVEFRVNYANEGQTLSEFFSFPTVNGVASMALPLLRIDTLTITAKSEPDDFSTVLTIPVQEDPFSVTESVPTPMPTETPQPTDTPVPPTPTVTVTPTPT